MALDSRYSRCRRGEQLRGRVPLFAVQAGKPMAVQVRRPHGRFCHLHLFFPNAEGLQALRSPQHLAAVKVIHRNLFDAGLTQARGVHKNLPVTAFLSQEAIPVVEIKPLEPAKRLKDFDVLYPREFGRHSGPRWGCCRNNACWRCCCRSGQRRLADGNGRSPEPTDQAEKSPPRYVVHMNVPHLDHHRRMQRLWRFSLGGHLAAEPASRRISRTGCRVGLFELWRHSEESMLVRLSARGCCAAIVGRVGRVKRGDTVERHRLEVFGFCSNFGGEFEKNLFCPCSHGVGGQGVRRRRGIHMECPAKAIGRRFNPTLHAGLAAEIDAAVALGVACVRDDHTASVKQLWLVWQQDVVIGCAGSPPR